VTLPAWTTEMWIGGTGQPIDCPHCERTVVLGSEWMAQRPDCRVLCDDCARQLDPARYQRLEAERKRSA